MIKLYHMYPSNKNIFLVTENWLIVLCLVIELQSLVSTELDQSELITIDEMLNLSIALILMLFTSERMKSK